ncbi:PaaI family thioesterase [Sunxiuqinia sp. A32]|uniref:PaaI family thioesterase n=1 Tax=Sunxiuqinia sp. A32 TaxID=3461496 RepID=UPI00404631AD
MDFSLLTIDTPLELINEVTKESLVGNLGILITRIEDGEVEASMPLSRKTCRPDGMLHGGSSLALAETLAGLGSMLLVDSKDVDVRGIQVTGNHTGSVTEGDVTAVAKIIHRGNQTHIWNVDVKNQDGRLISTARVTNMIVNRND